MMKFLPLFALSFCVMMLNACSPDVPPLQDRIIVVDAGHGGTADVDTFRVGPTGEREEWINLRVAKLLDEHLTEQGARVIMTRTEDVHIDLADRAELAIEHQAELFISVHHNATADPEVNFPIIYYHGNASENRAGVLLAQLIGRELHQTLFEGEGPLVIASDHTIFPRSGTGVLRRSYGIPGVITEASFFTHPGEEEKLQDTTYNREQAEALTRAIIEFFEEKDPGIDEAYSLMEIQPFRVFQEDERMSPEALQWREHYEKAAELADTDSPDDWQEAYDLATFSARSFPDSPVAADAHRLRAELLWKLGDEEASETERLRVREFYPGPGD